MFTHPADVVGVDLRWAKKVVTVLAIAVAGAGLGLAIAERDNTDVVGVDALTLRGAEMAGHLDTLRTTGQAQLAAMREAELIRHRVNTGQAQIEAMREAELIRQRINTGLVQQSAIDARANRN